MSPTVRRSPSCSASTVRTSDVLAAGTRSSAVGGCPGAGSSRDRPAGQAAHPLAGTAAIVGRSPTAKATNPPQRHVNFRLHRLDVTFLKVIMSTKIDISAQISMNTDRGSVSGDTIRDCISRSCPKTEGCLRDRTGAACDDRSAGMSERSADPRCGPCSSWSPRSRHGPAAGARQPRSLLFGSLEASAAPLPDHRREGRARTARSGRLRRPLASVGRPARAGERRRHALHRVGAVVLGYQWFPDWGVVAAYAGPEGSMEVLSDGRGCVHALPPRFGLRLHGEVWARPTDETLLARHRCRRLGAATDVWGRGSAWGYRMGRLSRTRGQPLRRRDRLPEMESRAARHRFRPRPLQLPRLGRPADRRRRRRRPLRGFASGRPGRHVRIAWRVLSGVRGPSRTRRRAGALGARAVEEAAPHPRGSRPARRRPWRQRPVGHRQARIAREALRVARSGSSSRGS